MTAKRDSKSKPEKDRPELEKEKLRDLTLEDEAEEVRGGAAKYSAYCQAAGGGGLPGTGTGG